MNTVTCLYQPLKRLSGQTIKKKKKKQVQNYSYMFDLCSEYYERQMLKLNSSHQEVSQLNSLLN